MKQSNSETGSFDHPPSPAELAALYSQEEQNDPRSLFYKRVLVRPKPPIGWTVLFLILAAGVCALVYMGLYHSFTSVLLATGGCVVTALVLCLIFAKFILIGLVMFYQALAPAKLRNRCRYEPSCSAYMILAVKKYGFFRGFKKGMTRWKGCKPPNGGYDLP